MSIHSSSAAPDGRALSSAPRTQQGPEGRTLSGRGLGASPCSTWRGRVPPPWTAPEGHTVYNKRHSLFWCFQKSNCFQTQLRYKIQRKMRLIPIFPHKAKNIFRNYLPILTGRSSSVAPCNGASPDPGTAAQGRTGGSNLLPAIHELRRWPPSSVHPTDQQGSPGSPLVGLSGCVGVGGRMRGRQAWAESK